MQDPFIEMFAKPVTLSQEVRASSAYLESACQALEILFDGGTDKQLYCRVISAGRKPLDAILNGICLWSKDNSLTVTEWDRERVGIFSRGSSLEIKKDPDLGVYCELIDTVINPGTVYQFFVTPIEEMAAFMLFEGEWKQAEKAVVNPNRKGHYIPVESDSVSKAGILYLLERDPLEKNPKAKAVLPNGVEIPLKVGSYVPPLVIEFRTWYYDSTEAVKHGKTLLGRMVVWEQGSSREDMDCFWKVQEYSEELHGHLMKIVQQPKEVDYSWQGTAVSIRTKKAYFPNGEGTAMYKLPVTFDEFKSNFKDEELYAEIFGERQTDDNTLHVTQTPDGIVNVERRVKPTPPELRYFKQTLWGEVEVRSGEKEVPLTSRIFNHIFGPKNKE